MARHVRITCPQCRRDDLRIRPEYLGRQVSCKYCAHRFLARASDRPGTETLPAGPALRSQITVDAIDEAGQRALALEHEIERLRSELNTRTGEYNAALQQLRDAEGRLGQSQAQARDVQEQLDQALVQLRRVSEQRDDLAEADAERVRLLAQVEVLRNRTADASRLEDELRADRAEIERLTGELRKTREVSSQPAPRTDEALERELEIVRAERDALRGEVQGIRAELVARAADRARLDQLTEESASLQDERDRLGDELLAGSLLEEQLRVELGDSRRLLVEGSARWEAERQAFLSRIEELQAHIRDVERTARDEQARSEAALPGWQERLDSARTQFDDERRAFEEEIRRLRLENETGGQERESAIRQADTARQELTQSRSEFAGLLESADHARRLYEAAYRRNDELDLQVGNLREELERLQRDHEAELREHPRHTSDAGDEPAVERLSTAPAPADRAAMLDRSAGDQDRRRTMLGHDGLATEAKVLRDPDPLPVPHGDAISGHGNALETARRQIEELTEQLHKARGANAQLSSILNVVGLIIHPVKESTGS